MTNIRNMIQIFKPLQTAFVVAFALFVLGFAVQAQPRKSSSQNQPEKQSESKSDSTNSTSDSILIAPKSRYILSFKDTDRMFQILDGKWIFGETDCQKAFTMTVSADRKTIKFLYPKSDGKEEKEYIFNVSEVGKYYIRGQYKGEKRLTETGKTQIWDFFFLSNDEILWHRSDWEGLKSTAPATRCQEVNVAANAPVDKPINVTKSKAQLFEEAIKPHIQKAKETYPQAKKRYLEGLPAKESFFITTRLRDKGGKYEQVFIAVKEIKDGVVKGLIWSDIQLVSGYQQGDSYSFPESELIDWTITKPDGSEEGNFVGKFLDAYQPQ